ncbi:MAG TPA: PAS domain-containing sensor histidine kinase [Ktedonobacteraceae bacterium]|nr:PAS domain-containing sensor histidine kinase [Ktedonobacteraceae bacterium]
MIFIVDELISSHNQDFGVIAVVVNSIQGWDAQVVGILERITDGFVAIDQQWRYIYINHRTEELLGIRREELLGKIVWEVYPEAVGTLFYRKYHEAMALQQPIEFEEYYPPSKRWYALHIYPSAEGLSIYYTDITDQKADQKYLQHLASLTEHITDALISVDMDYVIQSWNGAAETLYGWKAEEVIGKLLEDFIPAEYVTGDHEQFQQSIMTKGYWRGEVVQRRKDGTVLTIFGSASVVKDKQGNVIGLVAVNRDITEGKRMKQALQEHEQQLNIALETARLGAWQLDVATGVLDCTEICKANFGLSPETVFTYDALLMSILPEDRDQMRQAVEQALEQRTVYNAEYRVKWPDGSIHWIVASGRGIYGDSRDAVGMVGVTLDITERKTIEQRKDDFISIASHELKTPITTIKGHTQLLKRRLEKQGLQEHVTSLVTIEEQVNKLTRLIRELMDVSKIQAGKLDYAAEEFDVDEFIQKTITTLQQVISSHTIRITGTAGQILVGDVDHLEQVLSNLISNAVKYSPQADSVDVIVASNESSVSIRVRDYGIGIPQEQHSKLFERFYRVSTDSYFPGLGMGLYITSEIVKRHSGDITVESEEGKGSTFIVSLPLTH